MGKEISREGREDILLQAILTTPGITEVSKKTGIPRSTVYKIVRSESFQEKLNEARQRAVDDSISYLQGNLMECCQVLMDIVRDKKISPQVRVNAVNSVFQNVKGFSNDKTAVLAGMAVKIIDSV